MIVDQKLFDDFRLFAIHHLHSKDIDPAYPYLKRAYELDGVRGNKAIWRTLLYVALYDLGSARLLWGLYPEPARIDQAHLEKGLVGFLSTGSERRGFRGSWLFCDMVNEVVEKSGGDLMMWVMGAAMSGQASTMNCPVWNLVREQFESVKHNGTWAGYKWADLLKNVHGFSMSAPDIGFGGGNKASSPVAGLSKLLCVDWKRAATDIDLQKEFYYKCLSAGIPYSGIEEMETGLCDFNGLTNGRYYVGHDIDKMMEQLEGFDEAAWRPRDVFLDQYRGERGGWFGVRKVLKTQYLRTGKII